MPDISRFAHYSLILNLVWAGPASAHGSAASPSGPEIYILAGQSNVSGRGLVKDLSETDRSPNPAILLYGNDGRLRVAAEPLDDASNQLDPVSADRLAGVGPGLFFARALRERHPVPVTLLPCAKGGSSIDQWRPAAGRDTLYGSCIARVRELGGRVAGILWYQGETDAEKPAAVASRWGVSFETLSRRFRRDFRIRKLPIVVVQLSDRPEPDGATRFPSWSLIEKQQAAQSGRCTAVVPAAGLPHMADDLHLTTAAQRRLGGEIALAIDTLHEHRCR